MDKLALYLALVFLFMATLPTIATKRFSRILWLVAIPSTFFLSILVTEVWEDFPEKIPLAVFYFSTVLICTGFFSLIFRMNHGVDNQIWEAIEKYLEKYRKSK